jgi:hypothetical protein
MHTVQMSTCFARVTRAPLARCFVSIYIGSKQMKAVRIMKVSGRVVWRRWVRFADYIEADPFTLAIPFGATLLGLFIILFSW